MEIHLLEPETALEVFSEPLVADWQGAVLPEGELKFSCHDVVAILAADEGEISWMPGICVGDAAYRNIETLNDIHSPSGLSRKDSPSVSCIHDDNLDFGWFPAGIRGVMEAKVNPEPHGAEALVGWRCPASQTCMGEVRVDDEEAEYGSVNGGNGGSCTIGADEDIEIVGNEKRMEEVRVKKIKVRTEGCAASDDNPDARC